MLSRNMLDLSHRFPRPRSSRCTSLLPRFLLCSPVTCTCPGLPSLQPSTPVTVTACHTLFVSTGLWFSVHRHCSPPNCNVYVSLWSPAFSLQSLGHVFFVAFSLQSLGLLLAQFFSPLPPVISKLILLKALSTGSSALTSWPFLSSPLLPSSFTSS